MISDISYLLQTVFIRQHFLKGSVFVKEGHISRELFFVEKGLTKIITFHQDRTFILRLFPENEFVTIVDSFTTQQPSRFQLITIEDTTMLSIEYDNYELLCAENHIVANAFRKISQITAAQMMKRISDILSNDAATLYENFVRDNADILRRISLGDAAQYIGITPVSLSRIRAQH
jgi:CRP/FNR family transcriptional regulator, anaerobic regulatory protein